MYRLDFLQAVLVDGQHDVVVDRASVDVEGPSGSQARRAWEVALRYQPQGQHDRAVQAAAWYIAGSPKSVAVGRVDTHLVPFVTACLPCVRA